MTLDDDDNDDEEDAVVTSDGEAGDAGDADAPTNRAMEKLVALRICTGTGVASSSSRSDVFKSSSLRLSDDAGDDVERLAALSGLAFFTALADAAVETLTPPACAVDAPSSWRFLMRSCPFSRKPLANGLLSIFSCVIRSFCNANAMEQVKICKLIKFVHSVFNLLPLYL